MLGRHLPLPRHWEYIQNGIRLLDIDGNLIQTAAEDNGEPVDAKDTGEKG